MTGDTHYDLEVLAELAEGLLDVDTADRVREHLAVCSPCGELLADLAAVREVLAATPTPAMPMGVALRIDKALAAEAQRGGVGLAPAPDWDELTRDAPWERQEPEPIRLGVVADDGTVVPAKTRTTRRRRWSVPAVAVAAAAAVVGTAAVSASLLASGGAGGPTAPESQIAVATSHPPRQETKAEARTYALTDSGHNYSDEDLGQALGVFLGPAPAFGGESGGNPVDHCVTKVADRAKADVFAVDQGQYNGQEAVIMASWKNKKTKRVRIDVVDPFNCKNLRKPALGRW